MREYLNLIEHILDNGEGIKESILKYIYQPYYSTKDIGHGLGLAICNSLAKKINATVALKSTNKELTIFQIILPKEIELDNNSSTQQAEHTSSESNFYFFEYYLLNTSI